MLTDQIIPKKARAADAVKPDGKTVKSVEGAPITIEVECETVVFNNAKIIKTDIACGNGVILVINTMIMPPSKK